MYPKAYHSPQSASTPSRLSPLWLDSASDPPKAYHATGAWGKRGMTLQELTCAFDAFNEDEERVAIGFAWSEDCAKKLAEPLSDVKTVFSDLDGLRSRCSTASPTASPRSVSSSETLRAPSRTNIGQTRTLDEFAFVARESNADDAQGNLLSFASHEHRPNNGIAKFDETIKPSHKRRRTLSSASLHETTNDRYFRPQDEQELPARPPSRLGFCGDEDDDVDARIEDAF